MSGPGEADSFLMQEGLLYTQPKFGVLYTFQQTDTTDVTEACNQLKSCVKNTWTKHPVKEFNLVAGFDSKVWEDVHSQNAEWASQAGSLEKRSPGTKIIPGSDKFKNTNGFAVIMVRSNAKNVELFNKNVTELEKQFDAICQATNLKMEKQICDAKDVLSGIFVDGLGNKSEPSLVQETVSCVAGVNGFPGGSYMLLQKFLFDWEILGSKNISDIAEMIGRHKNNCMLIGKSNRAHIKCAHLVEPDAMSRGLFRLHRISMLFNVEESTSVNGRFGGANKEGGLVYISFSKSQEYIKKILENMAGQTDATTQDTFISAMKNEGGAFFYLPAVEEFGDDVPIAGSQPKNDLLLKHFDLKPERNEYLFYNHKEYMNRMGTARVANKLHISNLLNKDYPDPPSQRILHLLGAMFESWEDTWYEPKIAQQIPHLADHSSDPQVMKYSRMKRQATAIKLTLNSIYTQEITADLSLEKISKMYGVVNDLFRIHPKDLVAGKMPVYGLGIGQLAMAYLQKDTETSLSAENIRAFALKLNEVSGYGHVVPNHQRVLQMGLPGFIKHLKSLVANAKEDSKEYYECCQTVFEGVQDYLTNYATLAKFLATSPVSGTDQFFKVLGAVSEDDRENLTKLHDRLMWLAHGVADTETPGDGIPRSFLEATQLLFTLHSCLHLTSEPVSIGRIDVILEEFLDVNESTNQDVIDAFWIKVGEKVQMNRENRLDLYKVGTIAVPYRSDGRFPRGDGGNQWVQQVTIGGYALDSDGTKVPPTEKRIEISKLCLKAARRLPLNAPCLSLRVHSEMSDELLQEATKSILSGGAHPVLPHDDRLIPALETLLKENSSLAVNYSSDGCYEPIIPGKTDFSFCYVPLLKVLELVLNRGASMSEAGPAGMRGYAISQEISPGASSIKSLDDIKTVFGKQLRLQMHDALYGLMVNYGNIYNVYASFMLSSMIDGCLESGKDIYNGGAELKIIGLMAISFADTVDSLYAIQELCFGDKSVVNLENLVKCLLADWGYGLQEPLQDPVDEKLMNEINSANMKAVREIALSLPKLGMKHMEDERDNARVSSYQPIKLKEIATWLAKECVAALKEVTTSQDYPLQVQLAKLKSDFGADFDFALGAGTFEGYVGWGLGLAASANGRRKGQPISSDMSPSPLPQDISDTPRRIENVYDLMDYWNIDEIRSFSNASEVDLNVDENTSEVKLLEFLRNYANGEKNIGANLLTITVANQDTYRAAMVNPEQYDLLRVRTGGWSEFFVSFYTDHQLQHLRRVYAIIDDLGITSLRKKDDTDK